MRRGRLAPCAEGWAGRLRAKGHGRTGLNIVFSVSGNDALLDLGGDSITLVRYMLTHARTDSLQNGDFIF